MSQYDRFLWIDLEIRAGRYPNADDLCAKFEVSRRTAFADRDYLINRLGAPLVHDHARGGWTYTDKTYVLPALAVSVAEAAALSRSLLTAAEYLGPDDAKALARVAALLTKYIPPLRNGGHISASGAIRSTNVGAADALVDECSRAIDDRQRLHIRYYGAHRGEYSDRVVHPLHLNNNKGEWHLIAWCESRKAIRQFLLSRVSDWKREGAPGAYEISAEFDPAAYLDQGFAALHGEHLVTVKIRFTPYQSRWIKERIWHPTQILEPSPDGDGGVDLTVRVAGTAEITRWLLGYGPEAEVLEPVSLRKELAEAAKKLSEIYRDE